MRPGGPGPFPERPRTKAADRFGPREDPDDPRLPSWAVVLGALVAVPAPGLVAVATFAATISGQWTIERQGWLVVAVAALQGAACLLGYLRLPRRRSALRALAVGMSGGSGLLVLAAGPCALGMA